MLVLMGGCFDNAIMDNNCPPRVTHTMAIQSLAIQLKSRRQPGSEPTLLGEAEIQALYCCPTLHRWHHTVDLAEAYLLPLARSRIASQALWWTQRQLERRG